MPPARGDEVLFERGHETHMREGDHLSSEVANLLVQTQTFAGGRASVREPLLAGVQKRQGVQHLRLAAAVDKCIEVCFGLG